MYDSPSQALPVGRVLITGSADGLGREAALQLVRGGHEVVLHARDETRARQALAGVPGAAAALPGDLSSITSTRALRAGASAATRSANRAKRVGAPVLTGGEGRRR